MQQTAQASHNGHLLFCSSHSSLIFLMKTARILALAALGMFASLFITGCATTRDLKCTNDRLAKVEATTTAMGGQVQNIERTTQDLTGKLSQLTDNVTAIANAQTTAAADQKAANDSLAQKLDALSKQVKPPAKTPPSSIKPKTVSMQGTVMAPGPNASTREETWQTKIYGPGVESDEISMDDIKAGKVAIRHTTALEVSNFVPQAAVQGQPAQERIFKQSVSSSEVPKPYSNARAIKVKSDTGEVQVHTKK